MACHAPLADRGTERGREGGGRGEWCRAPPADRGTQRGVGRGGRVEWRLHMFRKYDRGRSQWVWDIVTGEETCVYQYDPKTKHLSSVRLFPS